MIKDINKVAVLGTGVMGAQIAAHLTNVNIQNSTIIYNTILTGDGNTNGSGINNISNSTLTNVIIKNNKERDK